MRDSFIFYRSFYEAIKELPREIQGEIYAAIMEYSLNGKETENLKPIARSIFILMKPQIDVNNKRFDNGKKGGRPREEGETSLLPDEGESTGRKPKANQKETQPKPNKNENKNQKDNENENPEKTNSGELVKEREPTLSFELFWDLYDKKVCRPKCEKKWRALNDPERSAALAYIPAYIKAQPEKQFRKNPETFLNQKSWNDEIIDQNGATRKKDVERMANRQPAEKTPKDYSSRF